MQLTTDLYKLLEEKISLNRVLSSNSSFNDYYFKIIGNRVNNPRGKPTRHLEEYVFLIDENPSVFKLSSKILGKPRGIKPNRD